MLAKNSKRRRLQTSKRYHFLTIQFCPIKKRTPHGPFFDWAALGIKQPLHPLQDQFVPYKKQRVAGTDLRIRTR